MTFESSFFDGTYLTKTSGVGAGVNTHYTKQFLKRTSEELRLAPLAKMTRLPEGEGKTVEWFGWNNVAVSPSGAYLTEGINPEATAITGRKISRQIAEWGAFSQHSSLIKMTHIDKDLSGVSGIWGDHAANIIDLLCHMEICSKGAYPVRADLASGDGSYTFEGTVDSATTTTVVDTDVSSNTNFGDANDDLNQSCIVMLTGTSRGQMRPITDFVTSSGTMTVSPAFDVTPVAGDTFLVVSAHGLASTNILTTANVRSAIAKLRNNKATPFPGGYYVGILNPDTEAGLMADTTWLNAMTYKDAPEIKGNGLFNGEVGMWGGVRWIRTTQPFRFPVTTVGTAGSSYGVGAYVPGTTYTNYAVTDSNDICANLILGQDAFGATGFKDKGNLVRPGVIIKNPGPGDTSNPLNRYSTVGWVMPFAAVALNPMFAVQLWTGVGHAAS